MQMEKDLNSHRKATGFSKVQDKMDSLAKKTSQAKADLQTSVSCLNDYQKQYYSVHVPSLLKRHEELNGFMGQSLTLSLRGFADLVVELDTKSSKASTGLNSQFPPFLFSFLSSSIPLLESPQMLAHTPPR